MQLAFALQIIDYLVLAAKVGGQVLDLALEQKGVMDKIVSEDRDPTPEEQDALNQQIKAAREILHS